MERSKSNSRLEKILNLERIGNKLQIPNFVTLSTETCLLVRMCTGLVSGVLLKELKKIENMAYYGICDDEMPTDGGTDVLNQLMQGYNDISTLNKQIKVCTTDLLDNIKHIQSFKSHALPESASQYMEDECQIVSLESTILENTAQEALKAGIVELTDNALSSCTLDRSNLLTKEKSIEKDRKELEQEELNTSNDIEGNVLKKRMFIADVVYDANTMSPTRKNISENVSQNLHQESMIIGHVVVEKDVLKISKTRTICSANYKDKEMSNSKSTASETLLPEISELFPMKPLTKPENVALEEEVRCENPNTKIKIVKSLVSVRKHGKPRNESPVRRLQSKSPDPTRKKSRKSVLASRPSYSALSKGSLAKSNKVAPASRTLSRDKNTKIPTVAIGVHSPSSLKPPRHHVSRKADTELHPKPRDTCRKIISVRKKSYDSSTADRKIYKSPYRPTSPSKPVTKNLQIGGDAAESPPKDKVTITGEMDVYVTVKGNECISPTDAINGSNIRQRSPSTDKKRISKPNILGQRSNIRTKLLENPDSSSNPKLPKTKSTLPVQPVTGNEDFFGKAEKLQRDLESMKTNIDCSKKCIRSRSVSPNDKNIPCPDNQVSCHTSDIVTAVEPNTEACNQPNVSNKSNMKKLTKLPILKQKTSPRRFSKIESTPKQSSRENEEFKKKVSTKPIKFTSPISKVPSNKSFTLTSADEFIVSGDKGDAEKPEFDIETTSNNNIKKSEIYKLPVTRKKKARSIKTSYSRNNGDVEKSVVPNKEISSMFKIKSSALNNFKPTSSHKSPECKTSRSRLKSPRYGNKNIPNIKDTEASEDVDQINVEDKVGHKSAQMSLDNNMDISKKQIKSVNTHKQTAGPQNLINPKLNSQKQTLTKRSKNVETSPGEEPSQLMLKSNVDHRSLSSKNISIALMEAIVAESLVCRSKINETNSIPAEYLCPDKIVNVFNPSSEESILSNEMAIPEILINSIEPNVENTAPLDMRSEVSEDINTSEQLQKPLSTDRYNNHLTIDVSTHAMSDCNILNESDSRFGDIVDITAMQSVKCSQKFLNIKNILGYDNNVTYIDDGSGAFDKEYLSDSERDSDIPSDIVENLTSLNLFKKLTYLEPDNTSSIYGDDISKRNDDECKLTITTAAVAVDDNSEAVLSTTGLIGQLIDFDSVPEIIQTENVKCSQKFFNLKNVPIAGTDAISVTNDNPCFNYECLSKPELYEELINIVGSDIDNSVVAITEDKPFGKHEDDSISQAVMSIDSNQESNDTNTSLTIIISDITSKVTPNHSLVCIQSSNIEVIIDIDGPTCSEENVNQLISLSKEKQFEATISFRRYSDSDIKKTLYNLNTDGSPKDEAIENKNSIESKNILVEDTAFAETSNKEIDYNNVINIPALLTSPRFYKLPSMTNWRASDYQNCYYNDSVTLKEDILYNDIKNSNSIDIKKSLSLPDINRHTTEDIINFRDVFISLIQKKDNLLIENDSGLIQIIDNENVGEISSAQNKNEYLPMYDDQIGATEENSLDNKIICGQDQIDINSNVDFTDNDVKYLDDSSIINNSIDIDQYINEVSSVNRSLPQLDEVEYIIEVDGPQLNEDIIEEGELAYNLCYGLILNTVAEVVDKGNTKLDVEMDIRNKVNTVTNSCHKDEVDNNDIPNKCYDQTEMFTNELANRDTCEEEIVRNIFNHELVKKVLSDFLNEIPLCIDQDAIRPLDYVENGLGDICLLGSNDDIQITLSDEALNDDYNTGQEVDENIKMIIKESGFEETNAVAKSIIDGLLISVTINSERTWQGQDNPDSFSLNDVVTIEENFKDNEEILGMTHIDYDDTILCHKTNEELTGSVADHIFESVGPNLNDESGDIYIKRLAAITELKQKCTREIIECLLDDALNTVYNLSGGSKNYIMQDCSTYFDNVNAGLYSDLEQDVWGTEDNVSRKSENHIPVFCPVSKTSEHRSLEHLEQPDINHYTSNICRSLNEFYCDSKTTLGENGDFVSDHSFSDTFIKSTISIEDIENYDNTKRLKDNGGNVECLGGFEHFTDRRLIEPNDSSKGNFKPPCLELKSSESIGIPSIQLSLKEFYNNTEGKTDSNVESYVNVGDLRNDVSNGNQKTATTPGFAYDDIETCGKGEIISEVMKLFHLSEDISGNSGVQALDQTNKEWIDGDEFHLYEVHSDRQTGDNQNGLVSDQQSANRNELVIGANSQLTDISQVCELDFVNVGDLRIDYVLKGNKRTATPGIAYDDIERCGKGEIINNGVMKISNLREDISGNSGVQALDQTNEEWIDDDEFHLYEVHEDSQTGDKQNVFASDQNSAKRNELVIGVNNQFTDESQARELDVISELNIGKLLLQENYQNMFKRDLFITSITNSISSKFGLNCHMIEINDAFDTQILNRNQNKTEEESELKTINEIIKKIEQIEFSRSDVVHQPEINDQLLCIRSSHSDIVTELTANLQSLETDEMNKDLVMTGEEDIKQLFYGNCIPVESNASSVQNCNVESMMRYIGNSNFLEKVGLTTSSQMSDKISLPIEHSWNINNNKMEECINIDEIYETISSSRVILGTGSNDYENDNEEINYQVLDGAIVETNNLDEDGNKDQVLGSAHYQEPTTNIKSIDGDINGVNVMINIDQSSVLNNTNGIHGAENVLKKTSCTEDSIRNDENSNINSDTRIYHDENNVVDPEILELLNVLYKQVENAEDESRFGTVNIPLQEIMENDDTQNDPTNEMMKLDHDKDEEIINSHFKINNVPNKIELVKNIQSNDDHSTNVDLKRIDPDCVSSDMKNSPNKIHDGGIPEDINELKSMLPDVESLGCFDLSVGKGKHDFLKEWIESGGPENLAQRCFEFINKTNTPDGTSPLSMNSQDRSTRYSECMYDMDSESNFDVSSLAEDTDCSVLEEFEIDANDITSSYICDDEVVDEQGVVSSCVSFGKQTPSNVTIVNSMENIPQDISLNEYAHLDEIKITQGDYSQVVIDSDLVDHKLHHVSESSNAESTDPCQCPDGVNNKEEISADNLNEETYYKLNDTNINKQNSSFDNVTDEYFELLPDFEELKTNESRISESASNQTNVEQEQLLPMVEELEFNESSKSEFIENPNIDDGQEPVIVSNTDTDRSHDINIKITPESDAEIPGTDDDSFSTFDVKSAISPTSFAKQNDNSKRSQVYNWLNIISTGSNVMKTKSVLPLSKEFDNDKESAAILMPKSESDQMEYTITQKLLLSTCGPTSEHVRQFVPLQYSNEMSRDTYDQLHLHHNPQVRDSILKHAQRSFSLIRRQLQEVSNPKITVTTNCTYLPSQTSCSPSRKSSHRGRSLSKGCGENRLRNLSGTDRFDVSPATYTYLSRARTDQHSPVKRTKTYNKVSIDRGQQNQR